MRIWIDLANSPHVPFFRALLPEFTKRGHEVEITARDFAETVPLAQRSRLKLEVIGGHGGRALFGKLGNLVQRAGALFSWARGRCFDLAVSHNSYSQIVAARLLGHRVVTLMDYEHQPANHLAFRFASRVIIPRAVPEQVLRRCGARDHKLRRYSGTKEDVYLAGFQPDPAFLRELESLGINEAHLLVVVRPPANEALYHRFENDLFHALLERLVATPEVKTILLPRSGSQRTEYSADLKGNLIIPPLPLDGPNLIAASDLVVSAGGTMNREAAALGVPAASVYVGRWGAIDEQLVREGRLRRLGSREDVARLPLRKKRPADARRPFDVRSEVTELILEN